MGGVPDTEFTQSARRHRVGRERVRQVIADPVAIMSGTTPEGREVQLYLGDDHTGRALEVGVLDKDDGGRLVIHVMDLREKYSSYYEAGKEDA
jgi:hypothetical protein